MVVLGSTGGLAIGVAVWSACDSAGLGVGVIAVRVTSNGDNCGTSPAVVLKNGSGLLSNDATGDGLNGRIVTEVGLGHEDRLAQDAVVATEVLEELRLIKCDLGEASHGSDGGDSASGLVRVWVLNAIFDFSERVEFITDLSNIAISDLATLVKNEGVSLVNGPSGIDSEGSLDTGGLVGELGDLDFSSKSFRCS